MQRMFQDLMSPSAERFAQEEINSSDWRVDSKQWRPTHAQQIGNLHFGVVSPVGFAYYTTSFDELDCENLDRGSRPLF